MTFSARTRTTLWLSAVIILLLASVLFLYRTFKVRPPLYNGFRVQVPSCGGCVGIDVSRYQNSICWDAVCRMKDQQHRLSFVFIKATEANNSMDRHFPGNWEEAREAGLKRGAYHFFHPSVDVSSQAALFIEKVELQPGDLAPVLDIEMTEQIPLPAMRDSICKWLTIVEAHYGIRPIIYSGAIFYNTNLLGYFDDYPLWIAHYKTDKPCVKRAWQFWQFSDAGRVNGISSAVDFNVFSGDSLALESISVK